MCNSKVIRSLSLLLLFSLFLTGFGSVNVSAAENLIDSDLRNWTNASTSGTTSTIPDSNILVTNYGTFFRLQPKYLGQVGDNGYHVFLGYTFDVSDIYVNHSYRFSISIPSVSELLSNQYLSNWTEDNLVNGYKNGALNISFGVVKSDGSVESFVDLLSITADNYQDLLGTKYVTNFTCPSYSGGNPCIVIYCSSVSQTGSYQGNYWLGKDMSLIDEDVAEEENFFSRLFEWFQEKFDDIGDAFSNLGNKLSTGLTNLGDRIKTFFSDLGTSISNGLNSVKEGIQNKLEEVKTSLVELGESLIEGIKNLFVPDEDYILEWKGNLDKLLQEHLGMIYTSANLVTDLVQKIFDIVFNAPDAYGLTVPEVSFEILDGVQVELIPETEISFDFMENKTFKTIYGLYTVGLYIAFGVLEVKYGIRVYKKVMAN